MATGEPLAPEAPLDEIARSAGFSAGGGLSISSVDKRRAQLWSVSIFVIVALTIAIALLSAGHRFLPTWLSEHGHFRWIVTGLVAAFAAAFFFYVLEKERNLRRLSEKLIDERVLAAALSNRLSEISALSEVGKAVNTHLDLNDVLNMILSAALELLGGTEGSVMLVNDERTHLEVHSYHGPRVEAVMKGRSKIGEGISGTVAYQRKPMLIQGEATPVKGTGSPRRHIHSSVCVPLVRGSEVLGVLNLNETEGRKRFTDYDLSALGLFAEHAAIAIGNARVYEQGRAAESKIKELDQQKSDFVSTVSHELKTPLTAIIGAARTVSRKADQMDPETRASFMEMIERQANRLLRLVQDVLVAGQIESGGAKLRRELIDLRATAQQVVQELEQAKVAQGRDVSVTARPESPKSWGDRDAIHQILVNLIENALKYSDGAIEIVLEETTAEATIEVTDHGPGIPPGKLQNIFDRFKQVDSSSTRSAGGFGLGLFIVKNLVDAHRGTVDVSSEPSVGTTFRVHLPKRADDRGRMAQEPGLAATRTGAPPPPPR